MSVASRSLKLYYLGHIRHRARGFSVRCFSNVVFKMLFRLFSIDQLDNNLASLSSSVSFLSNVGASSG